MSQPYKTILCVDAETRWSSKATEWSEDPYTLSKMTTEEYIRSPLFHAFGFCIHEVGASTPVQWYGHDELPKIFGMYDWTKTAVLAHNAQFDVGIMSMIYGINPCFIFDTLSMGRALRGVEVGNSLMKLAEDYKLPPKGRAVHDTNGLWELEPHIIKELAEYCQHDVYLCEEIFARFMLRIDPETGASAGSYPTKELRLIDMTVRMYTDPVLELDQKMLEDALAEDNDKLAKALERVGAEPSQLASNDQFADILRKLNAPVPTKPSPANKDKQIFAFAKTDALFQQMLNGDDEDVALLCEARLKVKSNMERNRAQRFIDIAKRGRLPVPLSYYGAGTGRWTASKGSSINMQNLKRGSALRKSIMAPEDHVIVVGDLSQIEPRVLAWLAGYETLLDIFRAGGDPYASFGSIMFSIPGLSKETHALLRQSAKSALLGCQYQLGWASFAGQLLTGFLGAPPQRYTKADAKQLGVRAEDVLKFTSNKENMEKMAEIAHTCTDDELLIHCLAAQAIINKYRAAAEPVVDFWKFLGERLEHSLVGGEEYNYKGVLTFRKNEIEMVNGMSLRYPDLCQHVDENDTKKRVIYTYLDGKKRIKLYPGKICNNCIGEGTRVLTNRGWVAIEDVLQADLVHDGVTFVRHAGSISKGVQLCGIVDGVYMTPDHEVLTNDGWKAASQIPRPYRPDLRHVDGVVPGREREGELALALPMQVRGAVCEDGDRRNEGSAERKAAKLWVRYAGAHRGGESETWTSTHTYMDSLVQYARSVPRHAAAGVQELWGAWHNGVHAVGSFFHGVFSGHGGLVPAGAAAGSSGQQRGVHARQLSLGDLLCEFYESPQYTSRSECPAVERSDRNQSLHHIQQNQAGLACGEVGAAARRTQRVFDIVNCGPRQRFVVKGTEGPFIVHNCTQGTARIIMTDGMLRTQKLYRPVLTVHDEQGVVAPLREAPEAKQFLYDCMVQVPKWMPGIPLNADVGFHRRYGLAKG